MQDNLPNLITDATHGLDVPFETLWGLGKRVLFETKKGSLLSDDVVHCH
jgi:hypothetical protein